MNSVSIRRKMALHLLFCFNRVRPFPLWFRRIFHESAMAICSMKKIWCYIAQIILSSRFRLLREQSLFQWRTASYVRWMPLRRQLLCTIFPSITRKKLHLSRSRMFMIGTWMCRMETLFSIRNPEEKSWRWIYQRIRSKQLRWRNDGMGVVARIDRESLNR